MSDLSYVRKELLPPLSPPPSNSGIVGWLRENLFSSVFNTILTLIGLVAIYLMLSVLVPWAISPTWYAGALSECREILHLEGRRGHFSGACWGVVRDRWVQLFFGFYPSQHYWRPIVGFLLLAVALAPVLFAGRVPGKLIWVSAAFPFVFPWLLWGGNIWVPVLVAAALAVGYVVYTQLVARAGTLGAIVAAVLATVLLWLYAVGPINTAITAAISSMRTSSVLEDSARINTTQPDEISALEAKRDEVGAELAEALAQKDTLKARHEKAANSAAQEDHNAPLTPEQRAISAEFQALVKKLAGLRDEVLSLDSQILKRGEVLSDARWKTNGLESLKERRADIASLKAQIAALPAQEQEKREGLENEIVAQEVAIREVERRVGLVGLEPVISRDFGGMMLSLTIGFVAIALSLPLGIVLALGRQSNLFILRTLCVGFIEFIRGVPLITLLFVASTLLNIFMPPGTNFDIILRVIIMATLFASAYMAEVIRGGLAALPKGQYEGADSLGLNYWQAQRLVIMPQALKISIPAIVSTFIGLFKDTTLVSIIALLDPLGLSKSIRADTNWNGIVWELYGLIALMFFVFCFSMSRYSMYLERRLRTDHH